VKAFLTVLPVYSLPPSVCRNLSLCPDWRSQQALEHRSQNLQTRARPGGTPIRKQAKVSTYRWRQGIHRQNGQEHLHHVPSRVRHCTRVNPSILFCLQRRCGTNPYKIGRQAVPSQPKIFDRVSPLLQSLNHNSNCEWRNPCPRTSQHLRLLTSILLPESR